MDTWGFHIFAIVNNATLNVGCVQVSLGDSDFIFWIYTQKRDCWIIWLFHFLFFEENTHSAFLQWLKGTQFTFLLIVCKKFLNGPLRPCVIWDLSAHSTSTYFASPQLTSTNLTSPHLHEVQGSGHTRQGRHLAWIFLFPHLTLILFRDAFLYLSLFCFPYYYYTLSFRVLITMFMQTCVLWLFYILNYTHALNHSLSKRTRTVCIEPHSTLSESHTQHLGLCGCSINTCWSWMKMLTYSDRGKREF